MEQDEFVERLLSQASLDEVDFACDLERVLADQVKYLRALLAQRTEEERSEGAIFLQVFRAFIADKNKEIARLREENAQLRAALVAAG